MKTFRIYFAALVITALTVSYSRAQEKNSDVTRQEREVESFDAINVGCAIHLFISQGDIQKVTVETDENLQSRLKTKVSNGELVLSCDNVRNASKMNVYITVPILKKLDANGAAIVKGDTPIKSDNFKLIASGASKVTLDLDVRTLFTEASGASKGTLTVKADNLSSEISGASDLKMSGMATEHKTEVSGAGNLKAMELVTDNTEAEVSGAGDASVMARKQLKADLSGAGSIKYFDNSDVKKISKSGEYILNFSGMDNVKSVIIDDEKNQDNDETVQSNQDEEGNVEITINNDKVVVVTEDSVHVKIGNNEIVVDNDGDVKLKRDKKKNRFDGHWSGLDLGINGYMTKDYDFNYPGDYSLLDLKYQKSINVNLNFFEQDVNLIRNHVGLVTGLGISWNNYRFDNDVRLIKGEDTLGLRRDKVEGITYEKSKLVNTYLTLPLMLEAQTNKHAKINSFHIAAGVIGGWRIGTHSKYVYDDGGRQKDKDRSDFYMNPFKLDAIAKIGWGVINLYATYSLTPMFIKDKGPELYPFSVGVCLTDLADL
jgi:hypothetical protein